MPALRVVVLWHQHQPYYKDLVSGEYRLPWVRLHALKDYYGMVKLLDEFPDVHQTFNLVPSLIKQIQDYVSGTARDPFLDVAAKPARDLTEGERRFALQYLFQANPANMIGRYPRYRELWEHYRNTGDSPEKAEKYFQPQDFTDLQLLSQIAWFDEFFLDDPDIAGLIQKGRGYSLEDQNFVMAREQALLGRVLPAHAEAVRNGRIEISTSAFYHPILPLVCVCRKTVFAIPRTLANNCGADSICTSRFWGFVRKEFGPLREAFQKKSSASRRNWECSGWPPTKRY
jgi:alpha-amylase/alpha-mannosidase (GH57 family)